MRDLRPALSSASAAAMEASILLLIIPSVVTSRFWRKRERAVITFVKGFALLFSRSTQPLIPVLQNPTAPPPRF